METTIDKMELNKDCDEQSQLIKMQKKLKELYEENDDKQMQNFIYEHICNNLQQIIEKRKKSIELKNKKKSQMQNLQKICYDEFISNDYSYYFFGIVPISFDGLTFAVGDAINQSNTIYTKIDCLLSANPKYKKYYKKLKNYILVQIRNRQIPSTQIDIEEEIMQKILNYLVPSIFPNIKSAIYFLVIIGDILKGKNHFIYYIYPNAKLFLDKLNIISSVYFNKNIISSFKTKYTDIDFDLSRCLSCLNIQNCNDEEINSLDAFNDEFIINLLCYSCIYSEKYIDSDTYLLNYCSGVNDSEFIENILFFAKNINTKNIVSKFVEEYSYNENLYTHAQIEIENNNKCIIEDENQKNDKNLISKKSIPNKFTFKHFSVYLHNKNIPNIFSSNFITSYLDVISNKN